MTLDNLSRLAEAVAGGRESKLNLAIEWLNFNVHPDACEARAVMKAAVPLVRHGISNQVTDLALRLADVALRDGFPW